MPSFALTQSVVPDTAGRTGAFTFTVKVPPSAVADIDGWDTVIAEGAVKSGSTVSVPPALFPHAITAMAAIRTGNNLFIVYLFYLFNNQLVPCNDVFIPEGILPPIGTFHVGTVPDHEP